MINILSLQCTVLYVRYIMHYCAVDVGCIMQIVSFIAFLSAATATRCPGRCRFPTRQSYRSRCGHKCYTLYAGKCTCGRILFGTIIDPWGLLDKKQVFETRNCVVTDSRPRCKVCLTYFDIYCAGQEITCRYTMHQACSCDIDVRDVT